MTVQEEKGVAAILEKKCTSQKLCKWIHTNRLIRNSSFSEKANTWCHDSLYTAQTQVLGFVMTTKLIKTTRCTVCIDANLRSWFIQHTHTQMISKTELPPWWPQKKKKSQQNSLDTWCHQSHEVKKSRVGQNFLVTGPSDGRVIKSSTYPSG